VNRLVGAVVALVGLVVGSAGAYWAGVASDRDDHVFVLVGVGLLVEVVGFTFAAAGASLLILNRGPRP
jgi:hypothetical protein